MTRTPTTNETGSTTSGDAATPMSTVEAAEAATGDPLSLYPWPEVDEADRRIVAARLVGLDANGVGRTFVGVPLTSDPRAAEVASVAVIQMPRAVVEPFRVRVGCYLIPASVVRAYQARARQR